MIRRTFLQTLSALVAAPALPGIAASAVSSHLPRATLLARAHNYCTPDMLARHLKVSPEMAKQVQSLLLRRGVITPPIAGASMATSPLNTHCITNEAMTHTNWLQKLSEAKARLQEVLDHAPEAEEQSPEHRSEV